MVSVTEGDKMGKRTIIPGLAVLMFFIGGFVFAQTMVTLDQAINNGVSEIETRLSQGTRVMVLDFNSPSQRLSNYVLDEMMTRLARNGKIRVVEKVDLEFVLGELNFQRSRNINDESARSIGRILGAQYVISGTIEEVSSNYVVQFKTMAVEPGALQTITRVGVARDAQIVDLMAANTSTQRRADTSGQTMADASDQTEADVPAQTEVDASSLKNKVVLSVGGGPYGKAEFLHANLYAGNFGFNTFKTFKTHTTWIFGASLYLNAEIFSYLLVDVSPYYLRTIDSNNSYNAIGGAFSLFGQIPMQLTDGLTLYPLLGVGYEMFFYIWEKDKNATRKDFSNDNDSLYLKPGFSVNYNLTGNLRLNARFIWDFLLYSSYAKKRKDSITGSSKYLELQHSPSLFVGINYVVLDF